MRATWIPCLLFPISLFSGALQPPDPVPKPSVSPLALESLLLPEPSLLFLVPEACGLKPEGLPAPILGGLDAQIE